jgi:glycosyltransferase involved in cell wall biosynthesis
MVEQPFFSIILPAFNRERSITKAIESLLEQTFDNWELLIVDDASRDQTASLIAPYLKDQRIKYLRNEINLERCHSRNRGIQESKGQYICFLDSDDYHLPFHLEELVNAIHKQQNQKSFFFTNAYNETESGERSERYCPPYTPKDPFTYFLKYTANPQRWCVHRDIMLEHLFDPDVIICEDMDTSLRMAAAGVPIFQVDERTTVYVAASDSFTHGDPRKWEKELFYLKRIFKKSVLKKHLPCKEKRRLLSMCYFHLGHKEFNRNRYTNAILISIKSFALFPKGYNGKTNKILLNNILKSFPGVQYFYKIIKK